MELNSSQLDKLIDGLEKSKSYLIDKYVSEASYKDLIAKLDRKINFLIQNSQLTIKLVSTSANLVSKLKAESEADSELRSLCLFEAVSPFKNIPEIIKNCAAIVLVFQSHHVITQHQHKLINLARKKDLDLFILIAKSKSANSPKSLAQYLKLQNYADIKDFLGSKDTFFDFDDRQHFKFYRQNLIERAAISKNKLVFNNIQEISNQIEHFYTYQINTNWRKIKQIKSQDLQSREVNNYQQQILAKTFNKIAQKQQQTVLSLRQKLNQSRSSYTNPFMPDSWVFELQEIVERSQIKLVKEKAKTYVYLVVKNGDRLEYIHSYVLNLYQEKVNAALELQWSKINDNYAEGELNLFIAETNSKIAEISILKSSLVEDKKIKSNSEPYPKLDLNDIIDIKCLKANSKLIFDYSYAQSSWFKLLVFGFIGIAIYLITKIYFGTGIYIGFIILVFQAINIITGQSIKKIKLKSHKKELQRTINNKYQIMIRLIVEQMIQTLIASLDKKNNQYQADINAISEMAQDKLDRINQELTQHQARKNKLEKDKEGILSLLNQSSIF